MANIEITIVKKDEDFSQETVNTDGYLLLYLEGTKVRMKGQMDLSALTPILTKLVLEKMGR